MITDHNKMMSSTLELALVGLVITLTGVSVEGRFTLVVCALPTPSVAVY